MSALKKTDKLFYADTNMDPARVRRIVMDGLQGSDGGELFMEQRKAETLVWDEGRLSTNSSSLSEGFGLRFIANDAFAYATSNEFSEKAILDAADTVGQMNTFAKGGTTSLATAPSRSLLFTEEDPIAAIEKKRKI
ncbi:MAG: DNA gyrase modulator [Pseudomonadota bacterium]|nr:DNA gyrase modulator [Pseudomonadota bacterium]